MLTRRAALAAACSAARLRCLAQGTPGTIALPARLNRRNQITIPVAVNRIGPLWCLLDTGGGPNLYLSREKAAELGVTATSAGLSAGPNDPNLRTDGRAYVRLDAGGFHRLNQLCIIKPRLSDDDGILGATAFCDSVIELDFDEPAVHLHPPAFFRYRGPGEAIPFSLWEQNPHVDGLLTLDGREPVKARMTVDTGAGGSVLDVTPKFDAELRRMGRGLAWRPDRYGRSTCRIARLAVGPFAMENPVVDLLPVQGFGGNAGAPGFPDALLGVEFLRRYRIFLDYTKKEMTLEPGRPGQWV